MTETDVEAYLKRRFVREYLPAGVGTVTRMFKWEGSPFFPVELIHELRGSGTVSSKPRVCGISGIRASGKLSKLYPASIQNMIQRKIDQLPTPSRDLLLAAAVQGTEFDSSLLPAPPGWTQPGLRTVLRDLDQVHAFVKG